MAGLRAASSVDRQDARGGETVHATCVVVGEAGILIRGAPGSGKSTLGRALIDLARMEGRFARLVSDDRTRLCPCHGRVVAETVDSIAGLLEARGIGILNVGHEGRAVVRLLVELSTEEPPRLPERRAETATLCGVMVSCIRGRSGPPLAHGILALLSPAGDPARGGRVTVR